jgi:hypothetical protein
MGHPSPSQRLVPSKRLMAVMAVNGCHNKTPLPNGGSGSLAGGGFSCGFMAVALKMKRPQIHSHRIQRRLPSGQKFPLSCGGLLALCKAGTAAKESDRSRRHGKGAQTQRVG